jgi:tetratricopeptide (TPR) repeat protein
VTAGELSPRATRLVGALLVVTGAAVSLAIAAIARGGGPAAPELTPALEAVRYRFDAAAPPAPAGPTLDEEIAATAARVPAEGAAPLERAALAELHLRRGTRTGDPADLAAAEALTRRALDELPAPNSAVLVLARIASARHDFAAAIELAQRHERGRSTGALALLATAHLARGELAAAASAADALVDQRPSSGAYLTRALVMQAQGRDAEAAFDFSRAAATEEPGDLDEAARLRALWARFLLRRGQLAGAARVVREALRIAPAHALAIAQDAELHLRRGDARRAAARFAEAFAASRQVRYLIDRARALEVAGDREGADALRAQAERVVRRDLAAGGRGHELELVEVLVDRGERAAPAHLAEAVALARAEVARRGSAEARFQLARALARASAPGDRGALAEAARELGAALGAGTRDARLYELAAHVERRRGHAARAEVYARAAAALDPVPAGAPAPGWRAIGIATAAPPAPAVEAAAIAEERR